ncbi:MAG: nucleotide exchange factor GrpE [Gammaproteobacteria bacterium]|nr:nucleotide exchange factor GrpE [Gammaproteobacteria bacterium]
MVDKTKTENKKDWQKVLNSAKEQPKKPAPKQKPKATAPAPGIEHPDYKELQDKLTAAETKANELWNDMLRVQAEAANTKRRAEQDITKAHKFGLEKFASDLLPIIDSLEHGLTSCNANADNAIITNIRNGMELTLKMFLDNLQKHHIKPINPLNQDFNPDFHQAMSIRQDPKVKPNTVVEVMQKGYTLHERLLRPALVIVSKAT